MVAAILTATAVIGLLVPPVRGLTLLVSTTTKLLIAVGGLIAAFEAIRKK